MAKLKKNSSSKCSTTLNTPILWYLEEIKRILTITVTWQGNTTICLGFKKFTMQWNEYYAYKFLKSKNDTFDYSPIQYPCPVLYFHCSTPPNFTAQTN